MEKEFLTPVTVLHVPPGKEYQQEQFPDLGIYWLPETSLVVVKHHPPGATGPILFHAQGMSLKRAEALAPTLQTAQGPSFDLAQILAVALHSEAAVAHVKMKGI